MWHFMISWDVEWSLIPLELSQHSFKSPLPFSRPPSKQFCLTYNTHKYSAFGLHFYHKIMHWYGRRHCPADYYNHGRLFNLCLCSPRYKNILQHADSDFPKDVAMQPLIFVPEYYFLFYYRCELVQISFIYRRACSSHAVPGNIVLGFVVYAAIRPDGLANMKR